jgi:NADH-quinone oxidoreductase subunit M
MNSLPVITLLTLLPLLGAFVVIGIDPAKKWLVRNLSFGFSCAGFALAAAMWVGFDSSDSRLQFAEQHSWIPSLGIEYRVGVDGLGILMVLLTAIVTPIVMLTSRRIEDRVPLYHSMVLFLQAGLFGTFTALNFFHWFLFWELSLIPAFFLIRLWGGPRRASAATQFFVYTMVGSVAMLLSFLAIYGATGTFDFFKLRDLAATGELATQVSARFQGAFGISSAHLMLLLFAGVFLGFAVKVPLIPFHTWLPAAYAEAPTPTTMMLTGLMSKMGVYGFLRLLLPLFPEQMREWQTPLLWFAVATIVLSACAAFVQTDLKRVFAYSSINHLGYCLLGVFALASLGSAPPWNNEKAAVLNGVLLQMFNHGLTAPILFCYIGFLEQRSGGLRGVHDFGGLRKVAPVFCGLMGIAIFASLGLPGLNGFVGEFLIFKGVYPLATWAAAVSVLGLLVTAVFLLTVVQRVFHGPLNPHWASLKDLTFREKVILIPATVLMFVLGICPQLLIGKFNATVVDMVAQLKF